MQEQQSANGSDFFIPPRYKLGELLRYLYDNNSNAITHILDNNDGTYSMMYHIVCEYCDYCESQGDCRNIFNITKIVPKKEDPYELVDILYKELENNYNWYGEHFKYAFDK